MNTYYCYESSYNKVLFWKRTILSTYNSTNFLLIPSTSKSVSQSSSSSLFSKLPKKASPSGDKEPEDSLRRRPVGGLRVAYRSERIIWSLCCQNKILQVKNACIYLAKTEGRTRSARAVKNDGIFLRRRPNRSRNSFWSFFHSLISYFPFKNKSRPKT